MRKKRIFTLLERILNLLHTEERRIGNEFELQPIHLHILQYLNKANKYSDTPIVVAEYLGLTKGTVSQSLILLKNRGLIANSPDLKDKRKIHCKLTKAGKNIVNSLLPPSIFLDALEVQSDSLESHLEHLLRSMQSAGNFKLFGVCKTCKYFITEKNSYVCGLTNEPLTNDETSLICREHLIAIN